LYKASKNIRKEIVYLMIGNKIAQKYIARRIRKLQLLAGIGSERNVETSGEKSTFKKLERRNSAIEESIQ